MCSGINNLFWEIVWVIAYAITAYFTFTGNMMLGMYWMAGTMFAESVVSLIYYFINQQK